MKSLYFNPREEAELRERCDLREQERVQRDLAVLDLDLRAHK